VLIRRAKAKHTLKLDSWILFKIRVSRKRTLCWKREISDQSPLLDSEECGEQAGRVKRKLNHLYEGINV